MFRDTEHLVEKRLGHTRRWSWEEDVFGDSHTQQVRSSIPPDVEAEAVGQHRCLHQLAHLHPHSPPGPALGGPPKTTFIHHFFLW